MTDRYRAAFYDDGYMDPLADTIRLMLWERRGERTDYLTATGLWTEAIEGSSASDAGIRLPRGFVEAIGKAVEERLGRASHADTEARVLREWLAVERGRVDQVVGRIRAGARLVEPLPEGLAR